MVYSFPHCLLLPLSFFVPFARSLDSEGLFSAASNIIDEKKICVN